MTAIEAAQNVKEKEQKKLDFKSKQLCKFAFLFNGEYDLCRNGYDVAMINSALSAPGVGHLGPDYDGSGDEYEDEYEDDEYEDEDDDEEEDQGRDSMGFRVVFTFYQWHRTLVYKYSFSRRRFSAKMYKSI